ncbi:M15 family peptidase [Bacillus sp. C1-1]|nr:M15 family peptidase [Bacillus sp. C1-1]TES46908.1 M15 family peptidase [Shouchella lehensis]
MTISFLVFYLYTSENSRFSIDHLEETLGTMMRGDHPDVPIEEIIYADELHPIVAEKTEQLIEQASQIGIAIIITDGFRTIEEQDALYQQGRSTNGSIVTHVAGGESLHNYGLAVDYALLNENGQPIWDLEYDGNHNGESDWIEVADIAKDLGFKWGGDWKHFVDYPHLEMTFGYSMSDIQRALNDSTSSTDS